MLVIHQLLSNFQIWLMGWQDLWCTLYIVGLAMEESKLVSMFTKVTPVDLWGYMMFIYREELQAQMNSCGTSQILLLTFGTVPNCSRRWKCFLFSHVHSSVSRITWLQFMHHCCLVRFQFQEYCGSSCWSFRNPSLCAISLSDFWGECSSLAPTSSNFSSVSTLRFDTVLFLSNNDPVCLTLFTIAWIVFLCGIVTSWNLWANLLLTVLTQPLFT